RLSTPRAPVPLLNTFACHPEGGPVVPSATSARRIGLSLDPHTGADPISRNIVPSALLKPASATGESAGQNAVATAVDLDPADVDALAIVKLLSADAAVLRQLTKASQCFSWQSTL